MGEQLLNYTCIDTALRLALFMIDVIMIVCLSTIVILTKFLRAQASELFGNLLLQLLQLKNYNVRRLQRNSVSAVCLRH